MDVGRHVSDGLIRVATLNLFGLRESWGRRREAARPGFAELQPDLVIRACRRFLDSPVDGVWASDHFGVTADLSALSPTGRHPRDGTL
jgi:hypothetical protein